MNSNSPSRSQDKMVRCTSTPSIPCPRNLQINMISIFWNQFGLLNYSYYWKHYRIKSVKNARKKGVKNDEVMTMSLLHSSSFMHKFSRSLRCHIPTLTMWATRKAPAAISVLPRSCKINPIRLLVLHHYNESQSMWTFVASTIWQCPTTSKQHWWSY